MGTANVTLYADWTLIPTYTVTYSGNGSTGGTPPTDPNTYTNGQTVTVLGNTGNLVKTGYAFSKWNTVTNGSGVSYTNGQTFIMGPANITLICSVGQYLLLLHITETALLAVQRRLIRIIIPTDRQ